MSKKLGIESLDSDIQTILESFFLPSNDFNIALGLSTTTFEEISITWQHFLRTNEVPHIPKVDFPILAEQMYLLFKSYDYEINNFGVIIGIPYQSFDAYVNDFQDELLNPFVLRKTGSREDVTWAYELQRRKTLGS